MKIKYNLLKNKGSIELEIEKDDDHYMEYRQLVIDEIFTMSGGTFELRGGKEVKYIETPEKLVINEDTRKFSDR